MSTLAWHIDTWAPRDGIAFASYRPAITVDGWRENTQRTVNLRPPSWEIVDVRLATALRAERLQFQRGFFSENGDRTEIAFVSLEELIEVVRRAYIAGGSDPEPPTALHLMPRLPSSGDGVPCALDRARFEADEARSHGHGDLSFRAFPIDRFGQAALQRAADALSTDNFTHWIAGAASSAYEAYALSAMEDMPLRAELSRWREAMCRAGLLETDSDEPHGFRAPEVVAKPSAGQWTYDRLVKPAPSPTIDGPLKLPAFWVNENPEGTAFQQLLRCLSSAEYWWSAEPAQRASAVLAAASILASQDGDWAYTDGKLNRRKAFMKHLMTWFLGELPGPLQNKEAEAALEHYFTRLFGEADHNDHTAAARARPEPESHRLNHRRAEGA